jgi:hypothetical protein
MANQPVTIERFDGLDLKSDITELGFRGASDVLNLDFSAPGKPRRRPGTERFSQRFADTTSQSPYGTIFYQAALNRFFSIYTNNTGTDSIRFLRLDQNGWVLQESGDWGDNPGTANLAGARFISFGTDVDSYLFVAGAGAGATNNVILYDQDAADFDLTGSQFGGAVPDGHFLAVTPWDNRLVSAGGAETYSTVHRVRFSTEGDPFIWGNPAGSADDYYVDLHPGDGEEIREVLTWGDYMFVFKQTKFFVFYGVDVGAAGTPVFNYRTVNGQGIPLDWDGQAPAACVAQDGVYFVNKEGVWRTTGGPPEKISTAVDPLFNIASPDDPNPYYGDVPGANGTHPYSAITHWRDRLLIYGYEDQVLVHHLKEGWWSRWQLPGLSYQSHLYAQPERFDSETTLYGYQPDLLYSAAVSGTNEYWRGQIIQVSEEADQDYGGNYTWSLVATGGTSGNFTINFHPTPSTTQTTASIAYNATADTVETSLTALAAIDTDDLFCVGGPLPNTPVVIAFTSAGSFSGASVPAGSLEIGTENVTNGNAALSGVLDGTAASPIECSWTSGATDFGSDVEKVVKDVMVSAESGDVGASIAVDLAALPATPTEQTFSAPATLRFRGPATNVKARQTVFHLENATDSVTTSEVSWRRATLNILGAEGGPQRGSGT